MPTYQYACTECGDRLEVVQRFSDDPLTLCAACGGRLRKVFSPVGIVFKGSGFYRTDSRSAVSGAAANGNGKPVADGSGASENGSAKSESGDKSDSSAKTDSGAKSGSDSSSTSGASGSGTGKSSSGTGSAAAGSSGTSSKVA